MRNMPNAFMPPIHQVFGKGQEPFIAAIETATSRWQKPLIELSEVHETLAHAVDVADNAPHARDVYAVRAQVSGLGTILGGGLTTAWLHSDLPALPIGTGVLTAGSAVLLSAYIRKCMHFSQRHMDAELEEIDKDVLEVFAAIDQLREKYGVTAMIHESFAHLSYHAAVGLANKPNVSISLELRRAFQEQIDGLCFYLENADIDRSEARQALGDINDYASKFIAILQDTDTSSLNGRAQRTYRANADALAGTTVNVKRSINGTRKVLATSGPDAPAPRGI